MQPFQEERLPGMNGKLTKVDNQKFDLCVFYQSNQKQINRALTIMKDQLNSTFLDEVKQEQERVSWFIGG